MNFEDGICDCLAEQGRRYSTNVAGYDRKLALFPKDVRAWVEETQPQARETLAKNHGPAAGDVMSLRLRDALNQRAKLDALRHGFDMLGLE